MYLHLGQAVMMPEDGIIGIFDLDNTTWSFRTRRFLERATELGQVVSLGDDLPRSFVLCQEGTEEPRVYLSQFNSGTLIRRVAEGGPWQ